MKNIKTSVARRVFNLTVIISMALTLTACATANNHYDPLEKSNRISYKINDTIDKNALKPLAKGYIKVTPKPLRSAVNNFFFNLGEINTALNDVLQGKIPQAGSDLTRFAVNSTLGVGGLVDVALSFGLEKHDEDFGQTLAVWGVDRGAYIVYPFLGSNTLRNTPNFITSTATDPIFWAGLVVAPYITVPITALKFIDQRAQLMSASDLRDQISLDPYVFTRDSYLKHRNYLANDGVPLPLETNAAGEDDW